MIFTHKDGTAAAILNKENTKAIKAIEKDVADIIAYIDSGGSGDKHFEYAQSVPSNTWVIQHNLGKEPAVTVVDSAGSIVEGDCQYIDDSKIILTFSSAFSGKAYLN